MKTKSKTRRVVNIDKSDFDIIKKYCKENSLKMSDWIAKVAVRESISTDIKLKICESIGEASMCWKPRPSGVFDSTHALRISDQLYNLIKDNLQFNKG